MSGPPSSEAGALPSQRERDLVRQRYSVRFFPENKQGEEKRPESKRTDPEWTEAEPLEVAMLKEMFRRRAVIELRRVNLSHFPEPGNLEAVRATAACLWVEKRGDFPFKAIEKQWKGEDILAKTAKLGSRPVRHEAIQAENRLHRGGIQKTEGSFTVNFNNFSLGRTLDLPVGGLVEQVDIPLGVLAALDGTELTDELSFFDWFDTIVKRPKMNRARLISLAPALQEHGLELGATVYRLDTESLDINAIKAIPLVDEESGPHFTFADLLRLHGIPLEDEKDLQVLLENHWRERAQRPTASSSEEKRKRAILAFETQNDESGLSRARPRESLLYSLRKKFAEKRMNPARRTEIEAAILMGEDVTKYTTEIVEGMQEWFLNKVINNGRAIHGFKDEDILELLGEVNLVFLRRLPRFSGDLKNFAYSCLVSALRDANRKGIATSGGIDMSGPLDRTTLAKGELVRKAYEEALAKKQMEVSLALPPTLKYPDGRVVTFPIDDVENSLIKLDLRKGKMLSLDATLMQGDDSSDRHSILGRTDRSLALSPESISARRDHLFAELFALVTDGLEERLHPVAKNLLERELGFPALHKKEIAGQIGVTESRISQLQNDGHLKNKVDRALQTLREKGRAQVALLLGVEDDQED